MTLQAIIYHRATGRVLTQWSGPPDQLDCNVPAGASAALVDLPPGCLYVCPDTLQPLPGVRPPEPEPGCTWLVDELRWQTPAEHAARTNADLQRQIEALEAAQARPLREVQMSALGLEAAEVGAAARQRLQALHEQITQLRAQRVPQPPVSELTPGAAEHD